MNLGLHFALPARIDVTLPTPATVSAAPDKSGEAHSTVRAMADSWASNDHTRRAMRGNKSRDTAPELAVRRLVHAMGLRYRVNARPLPNLRRTADLVFTKRRVAVFIDGCFWHACPTHHRRPAANAEYWIAKVERNRTRSQHRRHTRRRGLDSPALLGARKSRPRRSRYLHRRDQSTAT